MASLASGGGTVFSYSSSLPLSLPLHGPAFITSSSFLVFGCRESSSRVILQVSSGCGLLDKAPLESFLPPPGGRPRRDAHSMLAGLCCSHGEWTPCLARCAFMIDPHICSPGQERRKIRGNKSS
ncbi:hypothetical protein E2C01_071976 [Portunus trituberculatus]|uniref:Uncharacterized protein n=1 Tax=Portunus trituberculatus TaxID=210409 RepID=A0A5B7I6J1_PORTR|nr:hypothetical protein [Portunus trituberculatus]